MSSMRAIVLVVVCSCMSHVAAFVARPAFTTSHTVLRASHSSRAAPVMAIRAVQDYDASFKLSEECSQTLTAYMKHPDMIKEVCKQYGVLDAEFEDGRLFQPVPYSSNTPHGMPLDYEQFHLNDDVSLKTCSHANLRSIEAASTPRSHIVICTDCLTKAGVARSVQLQHSVAQTS
jgi:hypothetical protein